jgi:type IV secretory pathway TrbD component
MNPSPPPRARRLRSTVAAGVVYYALAFGAGFALGTLRVLLVVPRTGERLAELGEAPLMLVVTIAAARWVTRQFSVPEGTPARLAVGLIGLALLLATEFSVVLWLRGITLSDYFASRDPVSAAVYCALLAAFAFMPVLVRRHPGRHKRTAGER